MRVLHVYKTYYPDTLGGIEQVLFQLTRGLAGMGVENRIFTVSPQARPAVIVRPEAQVHRARATIEVASNAVSLQALLQVRAQACGNAGIVFDNEYSHAAIVAGRGHLLARPMVGEMLSTPSSPRRFAHDHRTLLLWTLGILI
eukprot:gene6474-8240_t